MQETGWNLVIGLVTKALRARCGIFTDIFAQTGPKISI